MGLGFVKGVSVSKLIAESHLRFKISHSPQYQQHANSRLISGREATTGNTSAVRKATI